jgi:hypothetical protein
MSRKLLSGLVAGLATSLAAVTFGPMTGGVAFGATLKLATAEGKEGFVAIYGFRNVSPVEEAERPIGNGLGRNFGFGESLLFQAGNGVGTPITITLNGTELKTRDTMIGFQLESNHTGAGSPFGMATEFVDMQDGFTGTMHIPWRADTRDRPWTAEVCSPAAAVGTCKVDAQVGGAEGEGANPGEVKIENVALNFFGATIQGTIWGKWINGASKKAPCIELHLPATKPAGVVVQTLYETQGEAGPSPITAIKGKACLVSANNSWYSVKGEAPEETEEPAIEVTNE